MDGDQKMSQKTIDIIRGISQAAGNMYDGAVDEKGEPVEIGLKREEGNPMLDKRVIDGCSVRCGGNVLTVSYHSELLLKDVYSQNLQNELEQTMADIVKYLKKQYRKITGNSLSLKDLGECDANVEKASGVRVFVTASKNYEISGLEGTEAVREPSTGDLEKSFRNFLDQAPTKRAPNDKRKAS